MRILEARARLGVARGNKLPQLQEAFAEYGRVNLSAQVANVFPVQDFDNWATGFNAAWELDFWGRFERAIEASEAGIDANVENYDDVLVILLAEVARTYVQMRTFEQRLRFAEENVKIQNDTLKLAQDRFREGEVSELDVHQARQNLRQTDALLPVFRTGVRQSSNALCTLTGVPPTNLADELGPATIPVAPPTVAVGIPGELLSRRPDVRRAERLLASQSAKIGVTTADLYPRIGITGTIQVEAENLGDLFSPTAFAGLIGPGIRWNILNYGRIVNSIRAEDAVFQRLAYEYQQTVLSANQEVEDAIVAFLNSQDRVRSLQESVDSARKSLNLIVDQYKAGQTDFNRLFLQQTQLVLQQDGLAEAQGERARNLIAVYKALGGGWQIRLDSPPPANVHVAEEVDLPEPLGDSGEGSNTDAYREQRGE
jgi:NodT family efflux transporter outer membrane factor (OMF) lipoprotein